MPNCLVYDYIEIACIYRIPIELRLTHSDVIQGVIDNLIWNESQQECLAIYPLKDGRFLKYNKNTIYIKLEEVVTMSSLNTNPHFDIVEFK